MNHVITGNEFCEPLAIAASETFHMDEERFRTFYEHTSRPLWAYISRLTGDRTAADDLVQESFYRLLRVKLPDVNEAHLKSYLYRIATNLVRDEWRKTKGQTFVEADETRMASRDSHGTDTENRTVLDRALSRLKPRERELLWLAYVEGSSHREISEVSGVKENSVRPLLLRARRKLAQILRGAPEHA